MQHKHIVIKNKLGLHARAAAKFVAHANRYSSHVDVIKNQHTVNGKSIMGLMMLAASQGTPLELRIEGEDEQAMMADLTTLIEEKFHEEQ